MTDSVTNFTTNSTQKIASSNALRKTYYQMTIVTSGTFGGGTVAFFVSPDNGVTQIPLKIAAGTPYVATAPDYLNFSNFGGSNQQNPNKQLSFWATVTGATNPNINVTVFDNV